MDVVRKQEAPMANEIQYKSSPKKESICVPEKKNSSVQYEMSSKNKTMSPIFQIKYVFFF